MAINHCKFHVNLRKNFFTLRVAYHWNRLPGRSWSPSLQTFQSRLVPVGGTISGGARGRERRPLRAVSARWQERPAPGPPRLRGPGPACASEPRRCRPPCAGLPCSPSPAPYIALCCAPLSRIPHQGRGTRPGATLGSTCLPPQHVPARTAQLRLH